MIDSPSTMFRVAFQLFRFRGLLATLTSRELKARYRGSGLGFLWSLVNPLLLLAVYTFVFSVVFKPGDRGGMTPYALFLVSGLFPWIWTSAAALEGSMSLIANSGLIRKAVFPAELLPMVSVLSNLVHFLFALPIVIAAILAGRILGFPVGGISIVALPAVILLHLPMVAGLALGVAALTVHFKDVRDLLANLLTLLFFLTPILFSLDSIRDHRLIWWAVRLNPFTPFILAYQDVLFRGRFPDAMLWAQMALVSLVFWAFGSGLFERLRETLAEVA
jgi:lipopolysaccharide transport system permease protein